MKIKKLTLDNFKGVRHAEYDFGDRTLIKGMNGSGKTSIADVWMWLISNYSYDLVSNPQIRPMGAIDEVVTTVTADLDFDGKPVQIQKIQKFKRSKSGTTSLTNSYMVNSVPKSEKQFKEAMSELGVDFDKFLQCSHPNVMLSGINNKKERDQLRNMLFQMASDITDLQVAESDPELFGITELLKNYKAEEIAAMQNNTLRKIRENYGKEGEILRAKIEGLESGKVDIDAESIRLKLIELQGEYDGTEASINGFKRKRDYINTVSAGIMEKRFKLQQMEVDSVADDIRKRSEMDKDIFRLESQVGKLKEVIQRLNDGIKNDRGLIESTKEKMQKNREALDGIRNRQFDESTAICPTCGQKLPPDGIEDAKAKFESDKAFKVKRFEDVLNEQEQALFVVGDRLHKSVSDTHDKSEELKAMQKSLEGLKTLRGEMGDVMKADMSGNEEYQKLLKDIADDEDIVASGGVIQDEINVLKQKLKSIESQIQEQKLELAKSDQNKRIDERIAEAREQQTEYEQAKANAEMVLDQLKTLNMKKNTMLQESVNKHFNLIEWTLYLTQKNGETKDACIPTINGKRFGESMNTALEIMAKIDAMNSIQNYFGLDYPIILDDAEHLDSESMKKIESDHQLIMLCVSDDERLVFE